MRTFYSGGLDRMNFIYYIRGRLKKGGAHHERENKMRGV
jgi:hypothetical protein